MARLRTLLFMLVFYGLSVLVVVATPVVALFGRPAMRGYAHWWAGLQRRCAAGLLGIRVRVEGERPQGPALFAAKHQAMFETLELARLLGAPAIVLKRELMRIPFWGWAAGRYGVIPVDRAASAAALRRMMRDARAARGAGRSVMIFPEGTRVKPGETPPLRPGFAGLYKALGLPVVPIAVDSGLVWPKRGPKRAGTITLRFGEPIPPGLPRKEIEARVHAAINALETDPAR
ncbi:lysophospholipid acyltransferase family protein [Stakelama saccharophila]|uniref:Lysophospholipid acyltransferase family protein n=1 Tax=Stakelama saccharophila TaxID=3075605 RepID=A0ABZ0B8I5_9SPHN|nr:lysophospholipid acyltransferase family protein [Stakelama sp. W311]WNO53735.1 lysophospholipid acyltransferase family protein [Stakelama sp. W311]